MMYSFHLALDSFYVWQEGFSPMTQILLDFKIGLRGEEQNAAGGMIKVPAPLASSSTALSLN